MIMKSKSYLKIRGGNKLYGDIKISGSKNAALPIICASLLTDEPVILENIPNISDIQNLLDILRIAGCSINNFDDKIEIKKPIKLNSFLKHNSVSKLRASILLAAPLAVRTGYVELALPGGCQIGARPFDEHLKGFLKLGIKSQVNEDSLVCSLNGLKGATYTFGAVSVTGTENIIMAAVLAKGQTVINNAAKEPEIVDLVCFLRKMGAIISGEGTDRITIEGVLRLSGCSYCVSSDRIELGSYMAIVAAAGGEVNFLNANSHQSNIVINKLVEMGCVIEDNGSSIKMSVDSNIKPVSLSTEVYPGFPTDLQAQFMALNATLGGESLIVENIYENRFHHAEELRKMGASINIEERSAKIVGGELKGAVVFASDLRAAAALVVAAVSTSDETTINNLHYLDRGYENFVEKMKLVGLEIERV